LTKFDCLGIGILERAGKPEQTRSFRVPISPFSTKTMYAIDPITQVLVVLSITSSETVEYASATPATAWKEALQATHRTPKEF